MCIIFTSTKSKKPTANPTYPELAQVQNSAAAVTLAECTEGLTLAARPTSILLSLWLENAVIPTYQKPAHVNYL